MAMDLIPRSSLRKKGPKNTPEIPYGMTHLANAPCPFSGDGNPIGPQATCCSFRAKPLWEALEMVGEPYLASLLQWRWSAKEAVRFSRKLRKRAEFLEGWYRDALENPEEVYPLHLIGRDGDYKKVISSRKAFNGALACIQQGAAWYERAGQLGFGVGVRR